MTGLQLFRFDENADAGVIHYPETGQSLRWARVDGTVWLHFADLCKGTGHSNPSAAIHLVEDDDRRKLNLNEVFAGHAALKNLRAGVTSGNAEAWFVNEDGFATLGLAGRGDGPRMFRRWVVKVVLPQFRRSAEMAKSPDADLDVIQSMVDAIRQQRADMRATQQRVTTVEAKVSAIEGRHDWFTALAHAKLTDRPTDRPYLSRVGAKATRLLKARGEKPVPRQDATFGTVNTYPADVLEQAFEAVSR
ncbi:BRO-N domain-containing protein [Actinomadura sediminis]|uniref:Bro-N domain-containing protein n=1 Tax=Actinomadura sediminis TaxID=1038904 RepID=A0ABW3EPV6_9ACTN